MKIKKLEFTLLNTTLVLLMQFALIINSKAQLTTSRKGNYSSISYLVNNVLLGGGLTATNITYQGIDTSFGFFNGIKSNIGMDTGVIICNGGIELAEGPSCKTNDQHDQSCTTFQYSTTDGWPNANTYQDQDLANLIGVTLSQTYSCALLQFDFVAVSDSVQFQYVFGSNEEPCFYNDTYFDDFGFFLSGPGIAGTFTNGAINLALLPGTTTAVSVKNVNCSTNSNYYVCNSPPATSSTNCAETSVCTNCPANNAATTVGYGGFTTVLTAKAKVQCGQKYHIKLGVANIGNGKFDSGVLLKGGSFTPTTNPMKVSTASASTCPSTPVKLTASGATSYIWSPAATLSASTGASVMASPTVSTTYTVVGTIAGACDDTLTIAITVNPSPTLVVTPGSPGICAGGSVNLNVSGASTYTWTPTTGLSCTTCSNPTANPAGTTTYYVTGTNANGCKSKDSVTITVAASLSVTATASPSSTICLGDSAMLNANGAATFTWSPSNGLSCTTCPNPYANPTSATTYTVTGTSGSCNAVGTVAIAVNPSPTITVNSSSASICKGSSATLTAKGGSNYTWSPSTGLSATTGTVVIAIPSAATTYIVTGTNGSGCTGKDSIKISINPSPSLTITASSSGNICSGGSDTIKASGASTYTWTPSSSLNNSTGSPVIASPPSTTTYTVIGTNAAGCTDTVNTTITVTPTPTLSISPGSPGICPGDSVTLVVSGAGSYTWSPGIGLSVTTGDTVIAKPTSTATYTITGLNGICSSKDSISINVGKLVVSVSAASNQLCSGDSTKLTAIGAVSYVWTPSTGLNNSTGASVIATPTATTTYSVTGTSGSGCSDSNTVIVTVNPTPALNLSAGAPFICFGANGTTITASGASTYIWSPSGSLTCSTCSNPGANPASTTTYTVTGTSTSGCPATDTISIKVDQLAVTAGTTAPSICIGGITSINASGGISYVWSPAGSVACSTCDTSAANPTSPTTYSVLITDALGCKDSANVSITVNPLPNITASATQASICSGNSDSLIASGASSYIWNPSAGLTCSTCSSTGATPSVSTTYTVIGTSAVGCNDTVLANITVNTSPVITIKLSAGDTLCPGQSVTMTANGGTSYIWSPSTGLNSTNGSTVTASPATSPTMYKVIGGNGTCSDSAFQTIYLYPPLVVNMSSDTICVGQSGTVGISVNGGKPAYNYVWNNGLSNGPGPFTVSPSTSTHYVCTVTDGCNTSIADSMQVIAEPIPVAQFTATPKSILGGQFVGFNNTSIGATNYLWTFGEGGTSTETNPYYQYNVPGTYYVTLIAANSFGCPDTAKDTIYVTESIFIPNVFTPNGDGQNDVFHVTVGGMQIYYIEIFNRWGERVFEANSPEIDWSGRSMSGIEESDGTYYYIIKAADYSKKEYNYHGYLQLIR
jgi:gliding motility-associated-like protein